MSEYFVNAGDQKLSRMISAPRLKKSFTEADLTTGKMTFNQPLVFFSITNDGTEALTFTINANTITVKPSESFNENFDTFTEVSIAATGTAALIFRAYGGGY